MSATDAFRDTRSKLGVETISDYRAFLRLETAWNRLVEEAGIDHPFLRHEWVRTWWECFGAGREMQLLVVKAEKDVAAIAPLMRSDGRIYGNRVRRLQSISNEHTPRFDFIVGRRHEGASRAIWNFLSDRRSEWDIVEVQRLPPGSRALADLPRLTERETFLTGFWHDSDSPYLQLNGRWEEYFESLDRKHRSNLRNRLKRLNRLGETGLEVVRSHTKLETALEEGLRIEASGWKGSAGTSIRSRPEVKLFYTKLAKRAFSQGWLGLRFLTVGRQRIAFMYNLVYRNKIFCLKSGYDPRYYPFSPGNLLCYFLLRDAFDRGLSELDLLGTDDTFKGEWTRKTRRHEWLYVLSNNWRMRLLHRAKFGLVPRLQRSRLYRLTHDAVFGSGRKTFDSSRG
jgi:CelD/BcsL family acetyltransferase involved in cellulose biosynthesis